MTKPSSLDMAPLLKRSRLFGGDEVTIIATDKQVEITPELTLEWKATKVSGVAVRQTICDDVDCVEIETPAGSGWIRLALRMEPASTAMLMAVRLLIKVIPQTVLNTGTFQPMLARMNRDTNGLDGMPETAVKLSDQGAQWVEVRGVFIAAPATQTQDVALVVNLPRECRVLLGATDILRTPVAVDTPKSVDLEQEGIHILEGFVATPVADGTLPARQRDAPVFAQIGAMTSSHLSGWVVSDPLPQTLTIETTTPKIGVSSIKVRLDQSVMLSDGIRLDSGLRADLTQFLDATASDTLGCRLPAPAEAVPDAVPGAIHGAIIEKPGEGLVATIAVPLLQQSIALGVSLGVGLVLRGCAFDRKAPEEYKTIEVHDADGTLLGSAVADRSYVPADPQDRAAQSHGFVVQLPRRLLDGRHHVLSVRIHGIDDVVRTISVSGSQAGIGQVEAITPERLSGWALSHADPLQPATLAAYLGDQVIGRALANQFRADLTKTMRVSGFQGFEIHLKERLTKADMDQLVVRITDSATVLTLPSELRHTARKKLPDTGLLDAAADQASGKITRVDHIGVSGWVIDPVQPEVPSTVGLYVNEQLINTVLADMPRDDVKKKMKTSGRNGFNMAFPPGLELPSDSKVEVRIMPSGRALSGSPQAYTPQVSGLKHQLPSGLRADRLHRYLYQPDPAPAPGGDVPSVAIIVLNFNGGGHLQGLFSSFEIHNRYPNYRMVVLDHGSTDDSHAICEHWAARLNIELIKRGSNYSFSASNNYAADLASEDIVFFLNNDILFSACILGPLVGYFKDPQIGALGLKLVSPDDNAQTGQTGQAGSGFVQHLGIKFGHADQRPAIAAYELPQSSGLEGIAHAPWRVPAVTGAALAMRRSDFETLGGFDERFFYGYEDVDLCLGVARRLGKQVICANDIQAYHVRGATRTQESYGARRRFAQNFDLLNARFGSQVRQEMRRDALSGGRFYRDEAFRVAFAVRTVDPEVVDAGFAAAYGLGKALSENHGWEVSYLSPKDWYDLERFDAVVAMEQDWDARKITTSGRDLVRIAWPHDQFDHWLKKPWLAEFDMIWAVSEMALDAFRGRTDVSVELLRLATDAARFAAAQADPARATDYCFAGDLRSPPPALTGLLDPANLPHRFGLFGDNWADVDWLAPYWRGACRRNGLPQIYASTGLVLDDCALTDKPWALVNGSVFDALVAGALVLSNGGSGSGEVFDGLLPVYRTREELDALVQHYLTNSDERLALVDKLRAQVLAHHTYCHRAQTVHGALSRLCGGLRYAVRDTVPARQGARSVSGLVARALRAQSRWVGLPRPVEKPIRQLGEALGDDVVIYVSGEPLPDDIELRQDQTNIWLHFGSGSDLSPAQASRFDALIVATQADAQGCANTDLPRLALFEDAAKRDAAYRINADGSVRLLDARALWQALTDRVSELIDLVEQQLPAGHDVAPRRVPVTSQVANQAAEAVPLLYWPDATASIPYQHMLSGDLPSAIAPRAGNIDTALEMQATGQGPVVFHLHWAASAIGAEQSRVFVMAATIELFDKLARFKALGGKLIWTLYDLPPRTTEFPDLAVEFCARLAGLADIVHVYDARVAALTAEQFQLPAEKLRIIAQGACPDSDHDDDHGDDIDRQSARAQLNLPREGRVFVLLEPPSNAAELEDLLQAFARIQVSQNTVRLVLAGKQDVMDGDEFAQRVMAQDGLLAPGDLSEEQLQLYLRAADFVLLAHRNLLTTGAICLAQSFGCSVIAPNAGLWPDVINNGSDGLLYDPDAPYALHDTLGYAVRLADKDVKALQHQAQIRARTQDCHWDDLRRLITRDALALASADMQLIDVDGTPRLCQVSAPTEMTADLRVVAVLLHYGNLEDTIRCTLSLLEQTYEHHHVVIISNDETAEAFVTLARMFAQCTVIQSPDNLGYAGGNNIAMAYARPLAPAYMWIVNPDTVAPRDYLQKMTEIADLEPDVAIFGSKILYGDRPDKVWFAGGLVKWEQGVESEHVFIGHNSDNVPDTPVPSDYITGASLMFRTDLLDRIGYIPEDYFLYFEETHWCLEAKRAGLRAVTYPSVSLFHHKRSEDGGAPMPVFLYYYVRNALQITAHFHPDKMAATERRLRAKVDIWMGQVFDNAAERLELSQRVVARAFRDGRAGITGKVDLN